MDDKSMIPLDKDGKPIPPELFDGDAAIPTRTDAGAKQAQEDIDWIVKRRNRWQKNHSR